VDASHEVFLVERAVELAERLLAASLASATRQEQRRLRRLARLIGDDAGRELVQRLTDDVLRIHDPARAATRFRDVVRSCGSLAALGVPDAVGLRLAGRLAPLVPRLMMPVVSWRIRRETEGVVLSAHDPDFARHVARRARERVRLNVNVLGEAILSDAEAETRLRAVRARLARPDVDYVSVKISAVVANLDPIAFDDSLDRVATALRDLYRDALQHSPPKFVNLDMEEYKDLELTVTAFVRVLDEREFGALDAGIVLQAYLPDAHATLEQLGCWALERQQRAGGRIKVRIVKGANLAMERVDAEQHGWVQAPYFTKAEVDASYKALLRSALRAEWSPALRVGVASHNLFDVAWALLLREGLDDPARVEIEMLEGMAPAQARAVNEAAGGLLLYAPVVAPHDLDASIAYLSRRLDENTSPENFLRALFTLRPGTPEFAAEADRFRASVAASHDVSTISHRGDPAERDRSTEEFENEPESDFAVARIRSAARHGTAASPGPFTADIAEIDGIMARATAAGAEWASSPLSRRRELLDAIAAAMAAHRFDTMATMAEEAGKTYRESDPEISEATDFARYYGREGTRTIAMLREDGLTVDGRGVVLVVAPWNFPLAIPAGGVLAALAAGNAAILKPAPETRRTAWALVQQLWEAGVPRDLVQFVACDDDDVGRHLVTHPGIDTVVLTGSYETAMLFHSWKPEMRLLAETSGKNSIVVTAAADMDAALRDIVRSAFGHAGQKCSAASLAIVEASVYDSGPFRARLREAVRSVVVGWPSAPATMMGPLISPPSGPLERALTQLDAGEEWLIEPRPLDDGGPDGSRVWSPGVKVGVRPGCWFHMTECFGPVLGLMRADDLDHALTLQNATRFGLTGGIHSLDPAEVRHWLDHVQVGNAYVNRHITGAVVRRQPFGGWKRSSVGGGPKAGGPHYVTAMCRISAPAPDRERAEGSFATWWSEWFGREHDPTMMRSERNLLRYRPLDGVLLRVDDDVPAEAVAVAEKASSRCGVRLVRSSAADESEDELLARVTAEGVERVRLLSPISPAGRLTLLERGVGIDDSAISGHGWVELARWLREQSISESTHRYGRITASALDVG
jgi:RHH-type proline utilization regulon transcriptional repressor/proline dehydrogenase/delta 1-pyrroline-5-carboxylate dehydrogenase